MSGYDPKKFDPNDPSTWPSAAADGKQWIAKIGNLTIEADPSKPGDSEAAASALRHIIRGNRSGGPDDIENIGIFEQLYTPPPVAPPPPPPADTTIRFSEARDKYLALVDKEQQLADGMFAPILHAEMERRARHLKKKGLQQARKDALSRKTTK